MPSRDFGSTVLGSNAAADADACAEAEADAAAVAALVGAAADGAVEAPPPVVHAEAAMTAAPTSANSRADLFMISSRNTISRHRWDGAATGGGALLGIPPK